MSDKEPILNRRRFLKRTSATGALAVGATANVSAKKTANVEELSHDALQTKLLTHGNDLLEMLSSEDVLSSMDALENARRSETRDGTVQYVGETQVEDGFLVVHTEPESDRAFAALWSDETVSFYDPQDGVTTEDISTMSHNCWCSDEPCSSSYDYQKCDQDGDIVYGQCNCF